MFVGSSIVRSSISKLNNPPDSKIGPSNWIGCESVAYQASNNGSFSAVIFVTGAAVGITLIIKLPSGVKK